MSHSEIKAEHNIRDDQPSIQMLVNLELHPVGALADPEGVKGWKLVIDHDGVLPEWWAEQNLIAENEMRRAAAAWADGLKEFSGSLYLSGTGITSLPDGLSVGGSLYLSGTGITTLPDGLSVGGYLDLSGTGITSLPDDIKIGETVYGLKKAARK
jgi:hypothetical protein